MSSVRLADGELEVRVFNDTAAEATVTFADASGWLVDLRGRPTEPFRENFPLRPFGIATARLSSPAARERAGSVGAPRPTRNEPPGP